MTLSSSAFGDGQPIPARYTCDDADHSPPLRFEHVPHAAQTLVLLVDDPDAGATPWVHWLVYDLPATTQMLVESPDVTKLGGREGGNSWGRTGWGGPCPPRGTHHYHFRLYAVDTFLDLPMGASRATVEEAMEGHVVAEATLTGTYRRG